MGRYRLSGRIEEGCDPFGRAQIVGIVDVYSALTSDRPFRKALTYDEAVTQLHERVR